MKSLKSVRLVGLAGLLAMPFQAQAFHPLITDDTGTQGAGGNQFEAGFDYVHQELGGVGASGRAVVLTYTRGVTDTVDAFVGSAYQTSKPNGWGNIAVGVKWRFYEDEASKLSLALKPTVLLPVSRGDEANGLGLGETSYGLNLIASKETSFGEVHVNAVVARDNLADKTIPFRNNFWRVSAAPVWAVAEGWKVALDLGLMSNSDPAEDATMGFAELGVVYTPNDSIDLSLGVIRDLMDGPVETTVVTSQLTWHF